MLDPGILVENLTIDPFGMEPDIGLRRVGTFRYVLAKLFADRPGTTLVDLGAGHCIFAKAAAARGYKVTAVDGRTVRLPPAEELGSIEFVLSDVRDFDPSGFEVILCLGLLYHLTIDDQVRLLTRAATGARVIVETQLHDPGLIPAEPPPEPWQTQVVTEGEYEGVVFPERDNPMASIGNAHSFWHTEASLLRLFRNAGFRKVVRIDPRFQSKYGARQFFLLNA